MKKADRNEPEGFSEFWKIWFPHRRKTDGRDKACRVFRNKILEGADPQDIIDGASYHIRTLNADDRKYIQLASTWMNDGDWKDTCHLEREYQARLSQAKERPANVVEMKPQLPANHFLNRYKQGA